MIINKIKNYWINSDCFSDNPLNLTKAFIHKDYNIGMHSHEFYEINLIINGKGNHYIEKMEVEVNTGDVFVIPPGILHGYHSENSTLDVYHIIINTDFFKRYKEELEEIPGYKLMFDIEPQLRQTNSYNFFLKLNIDELLHSK